ncbi:Arc family DNA-binding protein [Burkholderia cenocepacia]|uniref:Arc family DNA-binding protein n=1 Tax=Burkholderia cenocepacia TaxID=95486 RepID=UPI00285D67AE|nr:Arc family DNA-binding protein [Burkholderia cenocepacia]MDR8026973.1 Arc family DNA-binding protein [Burkholderia cenocepacia]MDR8044225.1 Arc family DNA-binding protein [Burkholderia cenocepacia]
MATSLNQDDYLKTALRLPRDLHAKIQEAAQQSGRSMNAEIIERLLQSLNAPASGTGTVDASAPQLLHQMLEVTEETERLRKEVGEVLEIVKTAMTPEELRHRFGRGPGYDEPPKQQPEAAKTPPKRIRRTKPDDPKS